MIEEKCETCGQRVIWESSINAGCTRSFLKIVEALQRKGQNVINPKREMLDQGDMTVSEYNNMTHIIRHGLLARMKGEPGNVSLTDRGIEYMNGTAIPKTVVVKKSTGDEGSHKIGQSEEMVTIEEVMKGEYWSQPNVEIREGRVLNKYPLKGRQGTLLDTAPAYKYPS